MIPGPWKASKIDVLKAIKNLFGRMTSLQIPVRYHLEVLFLPGT